MAEFQRSRTITFVLLNWNTATLSQGLIDSLARQTSREFDLIIVDNASDEPFEPKIPSWLSTQILRLERNHGFAGGMNHGIRAAAGTLICPANSDLIFAPTFVEKALAAQQGDTTRIGIIGGLILAGDCHDRPDPVATRSVKSSFIDATGFRLSWQGRLVEWRLEYETVRWQVFGVTGACPLLTRSFVKDIAFDGMVFDEHYHSYAEDIDLFIRARTKGWGVLYDPTLRAFHWGSISTGGKRRIFHKSAKLQQQVFRNMTWNILKNFTALELVFYLPVHVVNVLLVSIWALLSRRGMSVSAVIGGYVTEPLQGLKTTLATRRKVQTRPWYSCRLLGDMFLRRPHSR